MAMQTPTELEQFHAFVGQRLAAGQAEQTVDEALETFRQWEDLQAKLDEAYASSERGESRPFDAEETKRAVRERLAERGIVDRA
ncbi:MAG: hypothetical protein MI757_06520 [Pirellulales bacterium]|nr:hypothetical protein [Pirellulales bacterium]